MELSGVYIHPKALVESSDIGEGTRIWAFSHVLEGAKIGRDCNICDHTFVEGGVILGDRVTVKCGIYLWTGVHCEDDVFLGPNVVFTNDLYPRSRQYLEQYVPTLLKKGASIGANVSLLAGTTIGSYAMIGLGSIVTRDIPDYALAYGQPARVKGFVGRSGHPLDIEDGIGTCPVTKERYRISGEVCEPLQ